ncbi:hypothetical protein I552_0710 [Mycobacterium xenopi 3993]|nr:hypothetical protein I552_0710 [Mycobacterium xenopi 3993]
MDGRAGIDGATGDLIRRKIAEAVRDAAASGIGTLPGGLRRWADGVLAPPVVPWNRVLRSAVRCALAEAAGRTDYSYRRPSRRRVPGVVLPAMRGPKVSVAIVVDTSGSMSGADLTAALSETSGVLRSAGVAGERVQVLTCDAASGQAQKVRRVADVVLTGGEAPICAWVSPRRRRCVPARKSWSCSPMAIPPGRAFPASPSWCVSSSAARKTPRAHRDSRSQ